MSGNEPTRPMAKIAGLKFMQRTVENVKRENLKKIQEQEIQAQKWKKKNADELKGKKPVIIDANEGTTGNRTSDLYTDTSSLLTPLNMVEKNMEVSEIIEIRDEISKLRKGRRTFGGFNPVIQKIAEQLGQERRHTEQLLSDTQLDESNLQLSNNMRARAEFEKTKTDALDVIQVARKKNKRKQPAKDDDEKDTSNGNKKKNDNKDGEDDEEGQEEEDTPVVMNPAREKKKKKNKQ